MLITAYNGGYFSARNYHVKLNRRVGGFTYRKKDMKRRFIPHGILNPRVAQSNFNMNGRSGIYQTLWNDSFTSGHGVYMHRPYEETHRHNEINLHIQEESAQASGERVREQMATANNEEVVEVEELGPTTESSENIDLFDGIFDN